MFSTHNQEDGGIPTQMFTVFETAMVPDCVLANTSDATADAIIHLLSNSTRYLNWRVSCSHDLMQQAIMKALREPEIPGNDTIAQANRALHDLVMLQRNTNPRVPFTDEMLAIAVRENKVASERNLLQFTPLAEFCSWEFSTDEILRLEQGLQPHQRECYELLMEAQSWELRDDDIIGQREAQKLGFEDVREVEAAPSAVRTMFGPPPSEPKTAKKDAP